MIVYTYSARDRFGRKVSGQLTAESKQDAVDKVREMGYYVTSVMPRQSTVEDMIASLRASRGGVGIRDMALFTRQLATVLAAGLPMSVALDSLAGQTGNARFRRVIGEVRRDIESGMVLSEALAVHPQVFDAMFINTVRAGEAGGALDTVLKRLAISLERDMKLRQKLKSAMYYPAAVALIAVVLVTAMVLFVLPSFMDLFTASDMELPLPTQLLVFLVEGAGIWIPVMLVLVLGISWGYVVVMRNKKARMRLDHVLPKVPVVGNVIRQTIVARFCRTLGTLLGAGVPVLESLEVSGEVVGNQRFIAELDTVIDAMQQGERMAGPLGRLELLPKLVSQMVSVGEESGEVQTMLMRVADIYEEELDQTLTGLSSMVEPLIIIVLGAGIGFIVSAVFLPLVNMIQTF